MLKRIEKIIRQNSLEQTKKRRGLKLNPGLVLIGLRITGPWFYWFTVSNILAFIMPCGKLAGGSTESTLTWYYNGCSVTKETINNTLSFRKLSFKKPKYYFGRVSDWYIDCCGWEQDNYHFLSCLVFISNICHEWASSIKRFLAKVTVLLNLYMW